MSHVTEVKLKIVDLDAIEEAGKACGLDLVRDKKSFKWYGTFVGDTTPPPGRDPKDYGKCDHVLKLQNAPAGAYEIGLVKALDGNGYDVMLDTWGAGQSLVSATGGHTMPKLRREYAAAVATKRANTTLARKGFKTIREDLPGGRIRLKLRKR